MKQTQNQDQSQSKKSSKKGPSRLLLALSIGGAVVLVAAAVLIILLVRSSQQDADQSSREDVGHVAITDQTTQYWDNYAAGDIQGLFGQTPPDFWTYIETTYGYTQDDCQAGLEALFAEDRQRLGQELSCSWEEVADSFDCYTQDSGQPTTVVGMLETYGLDYDAIAQIQIQGSLSGDLASDTIQQTVYCVQMGDQWYSIPAMETIDGVCSMGYVVQQQYGDSYLPLINAYWNAFYSGDVTALGDMMPDSLWEQIAQNQEMTRDEAEQCMLQYIQSVQAGMDLTGSDMNFDATLRQVEDLTQEEIEQIGTLVPGLSFQQSKAVSIDYTMDIDGEPQVDSTSVILVEMDGQWYVFDGIYYFLDACETYDPSFEPVVEQYWNAFYNGQVDTIAAMLPESAWEYFQSEYGLDQEEAKTCMGDYIQQIRDYQEMEDTVTYDISSVEVTTCDQETAEEYAALMPGFQGEGYQVVSYNAVLNFGGQSYSESSNTTLIQVDGQWYVYDAMYYFAQACEYAAS